MRIHPGKKLTVKQRFVRLTRKEKALFRRFCFYAKAGLIISAGTYRQAGMTRKELWKAQVRFERIGAVRGGPLSPSAAIVTTCLWPVPTARHPSAPNAIRDPPRFPCPRDAGAFPVSYRAIPLTDGEAASLLANDDEAPQFLLAKYGCTEADLKFAAREHDVWRCPNCGRWRDPIEQFAGGLAGWVRGIEEPDGFCNACRGQA